MKKALITFQQPVFTFSPREFQLCSIRRRLLVAPGRRNAETMAVATKPTCVPGQHQRLMHIVLLAWY
jgi:hypothetical protein